MTSHRLPAFARYPGMPGEGAWVFPGTVTKLPRILGMLQFGKLRVWGQIPQ